MHVHDEAACVRINCEKITLLALELAKQLELVHDRGHALLGHDSRLAHLLHCKYFSLVLFRFHAPHLTEAASANSVDEIEMSLLYF